MVSWAFCVVYNKCFYALASCAKNDIKSDDDDDGDDGDYDDDDDDNDDGGGVG